MIFYWRMFMHFRKCVCMKNSLVVPMVHCTVYSVTMAPLDHLMTDLQEQVAREETDTNKKDMKGENHVNIIFTRAG